MNNIRLREVNKNSKAFSLIELSMVILIVILLIAGLLATNALMKKFRIQTAQT